MEERKRHYYLEALGIESYVPRWLLSGAAPSTQCELSDLYDEEIAETAALEQSVSTSSPQTQPKPSANPQAKSALANVFEESAAKKEKQTAKTFEQKAPPTQKAVRFELTCWRVGESLMVLDTRQVKLALPTDTLFTNIVRALGYSPADISQPNIVRSTGKGLTSTAAESHVMVQAFLTAQHERQPFIQLLLMGTTAARFGLTSSGLSSLSKVDESSEKPASFREAVMGKSVPLQSLGCNAVVVPSLAELLQTPALKKQTWQAIQPFVLPQNQSH